MDMPVPDALVLAKKDRIVARLRGVLPDDAVISDLAETRAYECDALTAYRCPPMVMDTCIGVFDSAGAAGALRCPA